MGSIDVQHQPAELTCLPVTAPYSQIEDVLLRDGGLIIQGLLSKDHISRMISVLNHHYPPTHDFAYTTHGSFFLQETKVLWSLAGRGPSCGHDVCMHPLLAKLRDENTAHAHQAPQRLRHAGYAEIDGRYPAAIEPEHRV